MPKAADADDAHPRRRPHAEIPERAINRDARAEQRRHVLALERLGHRDGKAPVDPDRLCVAPVPPYAGRLVLGAKLLLATLAPLADAARIRLPPNADPLPYSPGLTARAHGADRPAEFVPWNERVFTVAPIIVDQVDVRVADATMCNSDLDFIVLQLTRVVLVSKQLCTGRMSRESMDIIHRLLSLPRPVTHAMRNQ